MTMKRFALPGVLAAVLALAACSDGLGPEDVNPSELSGNLESMAGTFENNVAFQSLSSLSIAFPQYGLTAALRASLPGAPEDVRRSVAGRLASARRIAASVSAADPLALFPADVLGKTFEWDAATDQYVVGQRTGAPANGIRILLYAVNPTTGLPVEPVQELGSVDLTDESSPQSDRLGVLVRLGTSTVADYDVSATVTTTSIILNARGFLRRPDGSGQVTFDLLTGIDFQTSSINILYEIESAGGTGIVLALEGNDAGGTILFRVTHGRNSIEISGTETATSVTGEILYNGTLVGTISGDPDDPTIEGANGHEFTPQELVALEIIVRRLLDFLENFVEGIFAPADVVFDRSGTP